MRDSLFFAHLIVRDRLFFRRIKTLQKQINHKGRPRALYYKPAMFLELRDSETKKRDIDIMARCEAPLVQIMTHFSETFYSYIVKQKFY